MEGKEGLQAIAEQASTSHFVESYINADNRDAREVEGLGIEIATWAEWDGLRIMRVFYSALEDANFHTEASQVWDMIHAEEKRRKAYATKHRKERNE